MDNTNHFQAKYDSAKRSIQEVQNTSQAGLFIKLFNKMNEKAIECMSSTRDEPETALEYLKKVNDTLGKIETGKNNPLENQIDPNYKMTLYYNIATCYQRLGMLEECVDFLEMATKSLN